MAWITRIVLFIKIKKKIELFLESFNYMIFMTVVTVYALFGDDVRVLATNRVN